MKKRILLFLYIFILIGCQSSQSSNLVSSVINEDIHDKCEIKKNEYRGIWPSVVSDSFGLDGSPTQEEEDRSSAIRETSVDHPFYARKWFPVEEIEKREILTPTKLEVGKYLDVLGCYKIETLHEQFKSLDIYFYPALGEWIRETPHVPTKKYKVNNLPDETSSYVAPQSALYTDEDIKNMPITVGGPDVIYWPGTFSIMVTIKLWKGTESVIEYYDIDKRLQELSNNWAAADPPLGRTLEHFMFDGIVGDAVNRSGDHYKIILTMERIHRGYSDGWTSNSYNNLVYTFGYIDVGKSIIESPDWEDLGTLSELLIDMYGIEAWQKNVKLPTGVLENEPGWADRYINLYDQIADSWKKKGYIFK